MNWIDLKSNNTMTKAQLLKRNSALIRQKYSQEDEERINRMVTGQLLGSYQMSTEEQKEVQEYASYVKNIQTERVQAEADNQLLIDAIKYEKALERLNKVVLSEGREAIPEILEVVDEESGEVIQEYVPAVPAIEPLPATIKKPVYKETSETVTLKTVANPLILKDIEEREEAQTVIDNATSITLNLVNERNLKP